MASSVTTLSVFTFLIIVSSLGQPAAATTACRDCASSCSSVNYATPTGPCNGDCSPDPVCMQNCTPVEIAKCKSACNGSCNSGCRSGTSGSCGCDSTCSSMCRGAGGACTSKCTNATVCQSCKDKYSQQCTVYCNDHCV